MTSIEDDLHSLISSPSPNMGVKCLRILSYLSLSLTQLNSLETIFFGSGVSQEHYKSLRPPVVCLSSIVNYFETKTTMVDWWSLC